MNAEIYRRTDSKYAWRLRASNGNIIATDGGQGYENLADAKRMVQKLFVLPRYVRVILTKE